MPALVTIIANSSTKLIQKPKFYVGVYVPIAKTELTFRKAYKQSLTRKFFETTAIPFLNAPIYSLIDAEKEEKNEKFNEKGLCMVGNKANFDKDGQ